ncbi:hypothetical protein [Streptomyces palmae]|uniref:Peptidase inhibitor family I36 protein n=1 Tax=Streptomyces palmae TaxID=1701085 RepID=A0A4Z0H9D7_9ACTN|nr:hypothetical protein [Streptomyces palmae]TGB10829.1 hypothetical protein E4099_12515 [Streptomyces palmae]
MNLRTKAAATLAAAAVAVISGVAAPAASASAITKNESAAVALKRCSSGVDQPWSGGGRAYTYGWNTCTFAGWTTFRLFRYSGGKYRQVAQSGSYWSKFGGKSISAKCARGGHWYVASTSTLNLYGQEYTNWSRAVWLRNC